MIAINTKWEQVTEFRHPDSTIKAGAWQDHKRLFYRDWCQLQGSFCLTRNPVRNLDADVREQDGKVALFVERSR